MKSFGETIRDVIYWLYNGVQGFIVLCLCIVLFYLLGGIFSEAAAGLDASILHWNLPKSQWHNIGTFGLTAFFAVYFLAPVLWETIKLLGYAGGALAFIAGLIAVFLQRPFTPLFTAMAVWFFPVVFVFWLLRNMVARFRRNDRQDGNAGTVPYEVVPYE